MSTAEIQSPVAETASGMVMGREKNGVYLFCGIPYAAPPTGENRFKRPQPVQAWHDILDATRFGSPAPQLPSGSMTSNVPVPWDEDCLTLNVCTPAAEAARRPVVVWIHGGAYRTGQGSVPWYNGTSFATQGDIVTVTINYRIGALGFTDLSRFGDDYATSGINGIVDQITALQWVQQNIANFGGDPAQVTIAGESAGAFSVSTLTGSPAAQGLFQRAIPQSGAAHHTLSVETGKLVADLFLEELNATSLADLMSASVQEILEAQVRADERYEAHPHRSGIQAFYPVEANNEVLPAPLLQLVAEGVGADVPMLTGVNKDEMTMFLLTEPDEQTLEAGAHRYGDPGLLDQYRALMPDASNRDLMLAMSLDFTFRVPAIRHAELREKQGGQTWMYQFDWESRAGNLKATHALEIPFTFNTLEAAGVNFFIGPGELPQALADEMHAVWIAFIRGETPPWSAYTAAQRTVQHFDLPNSTLVDNEVIDSLSAWADVI